MLMLVSAVHNQIKDKRLKRGREGRCGDEK